MIYAFDRFELDLAKAELRADGEVLPVEPQVLALLALLVENSERLVSKDEIIEKVWDGRVVSEAAVASRIKTARQAIGDDGKSQQFIKTLHGQGYRLGGRMSIWRCASARWIHCTTPCWARVRWRIWCRTKTSRLRYGLNAAPARRALLQMGFR